MNSQRAINFINASGSFSQKARLRFIVFGHNTPDDELNRLFDDQREDGGFAPLWAAGYSSVDATCFRLAQAEQLGVTPAQPNMARALGFLQQRQFKAGDWEEDASVAEAAPSWAKPGDKAAQLYLTATCGFWLAISGAAPVAADLASGFLQLRVNEQGLMPSLAQTHWLAAALWHKLGQRDLAMRMIRHLGDQIAGMNAGDLAAMMIALGLAGLPSNHALMYSAAIRLEKLQDAGGPWRGAEGNDGNTTLEALRALKFCNRV